MRRLIVILLFLLASVWCGIEILNHPGVLLIVYQPWTIEMPLWFAALAAVVFIFLLYIVFSSIDSVYFSWFRLKNWLSYRQEHRSYSKTQRGLLALIEGRFYLAEKLLLRGITQHLEAFINYIGAAIAAHELKAYERREQYLRQAYQAIPGADMAVGLVQAQLQMEEGQWQQALAVLERLQRLSPRQPRVLQLLEKVYVHLGDWRSLLKLLPALRKAKVLSIERIEQLEKNIYIEMLHNMSPTGLEPLRLFWENIPKKAKRHPDVVFAYVKNLEKFPETSEEVAGLIRQTLKKIWHPSLAEMYSTVLVPEASQQLIIADAWLKMYGEQPALLLTLARLCVRCQLWGKAREHYEKCLSLSANAATYLEYGNLLERLNEVDAAREQYKKGLILSKS